VTKLNKPEKHNKLKKNLKKKTVTFSFSNDYSKASD
jgi:hypothetical protein